MRKPDTFTKTIYVVAWAGCTIPLSGRTFDTFEDSLKMFKAGFGEPGLRIERMRAAFVLDTFLTEKKYSENPDKYSESVI